MLLQNIFRYCVLDKLQFTAYGERGFCVQIDATHAGDRNYIRGLISTARRQMACGLYYGKLYAHEFARLESWLIFLDEKFPAKS